MNYGKENLDKRKKNISSKKNMKKKRVGVRFFTAASKKLRHPPQRAAICPQPNASERQSAPCGDHMNAIGW